MRIVHFSDVHIGVENYGRPDPETGLSTRLGDFLASLDEVVDYAIDEGADLALFCGDAYKSRDPSQTHQREFARRVARLSTAGVPVFLLLGNHDMPHVASRATALEIFRTLDVPNVYNGDRAGTYVVETRDGPLQIVALPWIRRSGFLAREDMRGRTPDQVNEAIQRSLADNIRQQAAELDESVPAVFAGHVSVGEADDGFGAVDDAGHGPRPAEERPVAAAARLRGARTRPPAPGARTQPAHGLFGEPAAGRLRRGEGRQGLLRDRPGPVTAGGAAGEGRRTSSSATSTPGASSPSRSTSAGATRTRRPAVVQAIRSRHIEGAIVRVSIRLQAEQDAYLRQEEIRQALEGAHFVASISREVAEQPRNRLGHRSSDGLEPREALRLYLESRQVPNDRAKVLMRHAAELMQEPDTD